MFSFFRGESAFCTLAHYFFWAKVPFVNRINELDPNIPLTAIYGGNSWMPSLTREEFEAARNGEGYCRVRVKFYQLNLILPTSYLYKNDQSNHETLSKGYLFVLDN